MRIKDVVDVLKVRPSPRKEDVQQFFNPWGVKQRVQKNKRPLAEAIHELSTKVVQAANRLQADLPSVAPIAEQPGASSAMPPTPQDPLKPLDILLANQQCIDLYLESWHEESQPFESQPVHKQARKEDKDFLDPAAMRVQC